MGGQAIKGLGEEGKVRKSRGGEELGKQQAAYNIDALIQFQNKKVDLIVFYSRAQKSKERQISCHSQLLQLALIQPCHPACD